MNERILTEKEKQALREFLEDGKPSGMIRTLRYRAKRFLPIFKEEIALLERFLEKSGDTS